MTKRMRQFAGIIGVLVMASTWVTSASTPRFWLVSTQADVMKGELDRVSVDDTGRIRLGLDPKPVLETTAPFIWCLAEGPDHTVLAGTGNEGQVWRIDAKGGSSVFFKAPEMEVHAIVAAPDGSTYVATSPDGKVYRLDAKGQSSVYFDPDDRYIWSMTLDANGVLFVGTGDKGVVYKVTSAGKGEVLYRTNARNVTSLTFERDGSLLAGTDSPGRLLRIDIAGRAFALFDSPFREVRGVHSANDGNTYFVAVNGKSGGVSDAPAAVSAPIEPPKTATAGVSTEIMAVTIIDTSTAGATPSAASTKSSDKSSSKGAVYRLDRSGRPEIIWESKDDVPFDITVWPRTIRNGDRGTEVLAVQVQVLTGNSGKVYLVAGDPARTEMVSRLPAQQVTAFLQPTWSAYVATSNPGRVFSGTAPGTGRTGAYTSDVKDAGMFARWGTITWRSEFANGSAITVMTRSGNTSEPDDTWSPWSAAYQHADGDAIASPAARYLQWKAVLTRGDKDEAGPSLYSVKVGYQQRNARPHVTGITVLPAGTVYQKPFPTGDPDIAGMADGPPEARAPLFSQLLGMPQSGQVGRRMYQKGLQAFTWKGEDDNDDRLTYDVFYRAVGSAEWKPLRRGLSDTMLTWDTTSVPDGSYVIKVAASDAPSNQVADVLTGEAESEAFDIDNTPPVISLVSLTPAGAAKAGSGTAAQDVVVVEVRDAHSPVGPVEFSIDGARWQPLYPDDGIADRRVERYTFKVPAGMASRVVVRASDTLNNLAAIAVKDAKAGCP